MPDERRPNDDDIVDASSYAGRWVARLRGKIVAQGGTPEQTLRAAQKSRHKEKPDIIFMPASFSLHPLTGIVKQAVSANQEIYLVGGAVRDMLLNRSSPDLDFALPSNGIAVARRVANALKADFVVLDEQRDTGRVIVTGSDGSRTFLDFAAYRSGSEGAGASGIESDLRNRDFTINALAYDLHSDSILDPLDGAADLRAKRVRACMPSSFNDDPIRILRAVRMAAMLDFQIDSDTREWMKQAVSRIESVSPERQRDELFKTLEGQKVDACMRALDLLGVLPHLLPELTVLKGVEQPAPHAYDVWAHTLAVLKNLEDILCSLRMGYDADQTNDLLTGLLSLRLGRYRQQFAQHFSEALNPDRSLRALLFFAALYHDISKPQTRAADETGRIRFLGHEEKGAMNVVQRAEALHLSNDEVERLRVIILQHMRFHFHTSRMEGEKKEPSRRAIYRFYRDAGKAGVDLVLLGLADLRGTRGPTLTQESWSAALDVARILLENYWEKPEESVSPLRLLDGHDLMRELNLGAGSVIGQLLEAIREGQATGKIETHEQAVAYARSQLEEGPPGQQDTKR
jgi:poly(A) polymerase